MTNEEKNAVSTELSEISHSLSNLLERQEQDMREIKKMQGRIAALKTSIIFDKKQPTTERKMPKVRVKTQEPASKPSVLPVPLSLKEAVITTLGAIPNDPSLRTRSALVTAIKGYFDIAVNEKSLNGVLYKLRAEGRVYYTYDRAWYLMTNQANPTPAGKKLTIKDMVIGIVSTNTLSHLSHMGIKKKITGIYNRPDIQLDSIKNVLSKLRAEGRVVYSKTNGWHVCFSAPKYESMKPKKPKKPSLEEFGVESKETNSTRPEDFGFKT